MEVPRHGGNQRVVSTDSGLRFPNHNLHDDVCTFTGHHYRNRTRLVVGGFPCKDISVARNDVNRAGIRGDQSGLWKEQLRIIRETRTEYAFTENTRGLTTSGGGDLQHVLSDLTEHGYRSAWLINHAYDVGAPHFRPRVWVLSRKSVHPGHAESPVHFPSSPPETYAWPTPTSQDGANNAGESQWTRNSDPLNVAVAKAEGVGFGRGILSPDWVAQLMGWPVNYLHEGCPAAWVDLRGARNPEWPAAPVQPQNPLEASRLLQNAEDFPSRTEALKALGNAWVPAQAVHAYQILWEALHGN